MKMAAVKAGSAKARMRPSVARRLPFRTPLLFLIFDKVKKKSKAVTGMTEINIIKPAQFTIDIMGLGPSFLYFRKRNEPGKQNTPTLHRMAGVRNVAKASFEVFGLADGCFGSLLSMLLGPQAFVCSDNSILYMNNTTIYDGFILLLSGTSQANIEFSGVYGIYIYGHSRADITSTEIYFISVSSSYPNSYALNLSYSIVDTLSTVGWKYI